VLVYHLVLHYEYWFITYCHIFVLVYHLVLHLITGLSLSFTALFWFIALSYILVLVYRLVLHYQYWIIT